MQLFRKEQVLSSNLSVGSTRSRVKAGLRAGFPFPGAHFAEMATPVRAKWPPRIGVLATPSEAASAADAGRPRHPLILTSSRCVAGLVAG